VTALTQAVEAAVTELAELLLSSALERVTAQLLDEAEEGSGEREVEPVEVPKAKAPRKMRRPANSAPNDPEIPGRILAEIGRKPGATLADIGRALGIRPDLARYHGKRLRADGLLRREGSQSGARWYLTGAAPSHSATDEPAPATQRSERAPALEAADPEAAIIAHLRKSPASLEGIRRACCPDWQEAPLGRLLQALKGRGLVEGVRGRAGLVTWRIKGAA
jgi:DNA-binding Lrp family transcriptional regulator